MRRKEMDKRGKLNANQLAGVVSSRKPLNKTNSLSNRSKCNAVSRKQSYSPGGHLACNIASPREPWLSGRKTSHKALNVQSLLQDHRGLSLSTAVTEA